MLGRLAMSVCVAVCLVLPLGLGSAVASTDPEAVAVVTELPARHRADPRAATPVGLTNEFGVVTWREPDPDPSAHYRAAVVEVLADGSSVAALDRHVDAVFGNRLVAASGAAPTSSVASRMLPSTEWRATSVPAGWTLVDVTADGLVVTDGADPSRLGVVAWDSGDLRAVSGVPAGVAGVHALSEWRAGSASHGTVLGIHTGGSSDWLYVDTATGDAWPLRLDSPGPCSRRPDTSTPWGLHDGVLAWHADPTDGATAPQLCTLALPQPGDAAVADAAMRPVPEFPGVDNQVLDVELLPLGDDVLTWRRPQFGMLGGWSAATPLPVTAVGEDGAASVIAAWGHSVRPAGAGRVVLVGGDSPADVAIRTVGSDGSSSAVASLPRIGATFWSIAVDGASVAFVDDSASRQALVENRVTSGGGWADGLGAEVDSGVTAALVARDGSLAWAPASPAGLSVGDRWALRTPDGTVRRGPAFLSGITPAQVRSVSGRWLLRSYQGSDYLLDSTVGDYGVTRASDGAADLQDGVLYLPNARVPGAPDNVVVARDQRTGLGAAVPTPGCAKSSRVRVAGSWLMLRCSGGGPTLETVVDRTGAHAPRAVPTGAVLGDGFVVRSEPDGKLLWAPLTEPGALAWAPVDTSRVPLAADTTRGIASWAVSTTAPRVAWFSRRQARVATLPLPSSALPTPPTAVTPPATPEDVTADPTDRAITLRWAAPLSSTPVWAYELRVGTKVKTVPGDATAGTISGLTNGTAYRGSVTAINAAGETVGASVTATPIAPPAPPRNVTVSVDPLTSRVTLTWEWAAAPGAEPLQRFEVWSTGPVATVGPEARRASYVETDSGSGNLRVLAVGPRQTSGATTDVVAFPGVDDVAPTAAAQVAAPVVLGSATTVKVRAKDDRQLASVAVRVRSAPIGQRLGAWQSPSSWQGRQPGSVKATGLQQGHTYCYAARARDHAGNVGAWSKPSCTVVPLDDRALAAFGWKQVTGPRWFAGTARRATAPVATLTSPGVSGEELWIVATTCPGCGKVRVLLDGSQLAVLDLRSTTTRDQQVLRVPTSRLLRGRISLRPAAGGSPVLIDAIAVRGY